RSLRRCLMRSSCESASFIATSNRRSSRSTSSGAMCCLGVLTRLRSTRYTRPMAIPGEAAIPNNLVIDPTSAKLVSLLLPELPPPQFAQRLQRHRRVRSERPDVNRRPLGGDQHENAHDAFAVDGLPVLLDLNLAAILVRSLHELGGRARVHAERVRDLERLL